MSHLCALCDVFAFFCSSGRIDLSDRHELEPHLHIQTEFIGKDAVFEYVSILIYDSHSLVLVVCVAILIYDSYRLVLVFVLCISIINTHL